jgi:hypothetical protein
MINHSLETDVERQSGKREEEEDRSKGGSKKMNGNAYKLKLGENATVPVFYYTARVMSCIKGAR